MKRTAEPRKAGKKECYNAVLIQINDRDTVADTDGDGKITFADIGTNFIEVSKSRASYIYLTAKANGHAHDSVTLTATKSGEKVKILDNRSYSIVVTDEWLSLPERNRFRRYKLMESRFIQLVHHCKKFRKAWKKFWLLHYDESYRIVVICKFCFLKNYN